MIPMSSACRDRICGGCTGYTDGHATWVCGHDCHRYDARGVQITAPGRRVAVVASPAQLAADNARAQQQAVVAACQRMWESVADRDDATREAVRSVIDQAIELAEDTGNVAVIKAAEIDGAIGSEPIPWEQVKDVTP